jgi:hypothetical protein
MFKAFTVIRKIGQVIANSKNKSHLCFGKLILITDLKRKHLMRKVLFAYLILFLLSHSTTIIAQNFLTYNAESVRMTVDGAASNFFSLKKKKRQTAETRQALGGVLYQGLDGVGTGFYGVTYNFAYPIKEIGSGGLYVAVNPALGANGSANSRDGGSFSYGIDVPIMAEMHFGDKEAFGGLVGLGFAYSYMSVSDANINHKAVGPVASAGIRIPLGGQTYLLKASYQLNLTKQTLGTYTTGNVLGFTAAWTF